MTLDELHDDLVEDTDTFLTKLRTEEDAREKRFPGYPPYLNDTSLEKIERFVEEEAAWLREVLSGMFGSIVVEQIHPKKMQYWMRTLAQKVAHEAAGAMSNEAFKQAQQSSSNLINGVLAGINIGKGNAEASAPEGER